MGCLCLVFFLMWFFGKDRVGHPLLYWPLTFAMLFKFFRLLHEWYHYWGIGRISRRKQPVAKAGQSTFTVDVITTFYPGEPYEMIKATLLAIKDIRYPHETYLGDEGNDPELKAFCQAHGIHHITRSTRTNAKAGNVNNVLSHSKGDLCLILDPDHEPHPLFLDRVLPYFEDEQIGFVQTVQAYKNQKASLVAFGAAEQTYHFYGPLMMSMSNYGTAQAIGANCIFRRKALDSIGGHAAGLAEDMHTSMLLHAKGWKSVYVPEILSRGLVPATLSAFYKQQLKWSRGTLELLFFVLPKIWSSLKARQRFHYLTLPFYYLSAFVILIDLAIPAISLFIGRTPWLVSLDRFMIFVIPVVCLTILIRQYAQRWLLEHQERGFVLTGGLLKLGAWWIYLLGFFTTVFRVNILYIPTPKEDTPENEKALNIPNLLVAGLCLFAVWYGLRQDLSPYSFVMAAFSLLNAVILLVNVLISQQKTIEKVRAFLRSQEQAYYRSKRLRVHWWKLRHSFYYLIRTRAIILLLAVMALMVIYTNWVERTSLQAIYFSEPPAGEEVFYKGISIPAIQKLEQKDSLSWVLDAAGFDPSIISFYLPWDEGQDFPAALLQQIYQENKIPMISWDPWNKLNAQPLNYQDLLERIVDGSSDAYLERTADRLAQLQKPVFIRFAYAFDKPQHPWSAVIPDEPEKFQQAWQYVVELFRREGAYNAIWVFNPWEPQSFEAFYPGDAYVDWLGVTIQQHENQGRKSKNFKELYLPFEAAISRSSFLRKEPLMLILFDSQGIKQENIAWLKAAEAFLQEEEQVKSLIYFNPSAEKNLPPAEASFSLHKTTTAPAGPASSTKINKQKVSNLINQKTTGRGVSANKATREDLSAIRAIMYQPVSYWNESYLPLTNFQLEKDLQKIKALQLNTIFHPVSNIYDRNVYHTTQKYGLNVIQGITKEPLSVLSKVYQYEHLIAWWIGKIPIDNSDFWSPENHYEFQREVAQLEKIAAAVKEKDSRPVITTVEYSTLLRAAPFLFRSLPHVDLLEISTVPGDDLEAIARIWQYYQPAQEYLVKIAQQEISATPGEEIRVSDQQVASRFRSLLQKSRKEAEGYNGFVYQNWMDKNLGMPEGGIVNPQGEIKRVYLEGVMPETKIFLYSNDPEHALKTGKRYQFFAVSDQKPDAENLNYEWHIFDKTTGEEVEFDVLNERANSIYFSPWAKGSYQIILSTRRKNQLLYNTYLEVKVTQ